MRTMKLQICKYVLTVNGFSAADSDYTDLGLEFFRVQDTFVFENHPAVDISSKSILVSRYASFSMKL